MSSSRVARRYAKALFALAREQGVHDGVAAELAGLRAAFAEPRLQAVLGSPMMTVPRLLALARELARTLKLSALTANFLGVLATNRRLDQLSGVCGRFEELHDRALGRIRIGIRTATALSPERQQGIVRAFEHLTGSSVLATVTVQPELLGGQVVDAAGKVYDGSLRTQLDRLAREITSARTYL
ncbi:MAG: ATP synthase F1 subunit delta [Deltaproteobacteria bacterium]|nr:ATP synthase F1 subunit delta [Deltaproteobacteria bacterium]